MTIAGGWRSFPAGVGTARMSIPVDPEASRDDAWDKRWYPGGPAGTPESQRESVREAGTQISFNLCPNDGFALMLLTTSATRLCCSVCGFWIEGVTHGGETVAVSVHASTTVVVRDSCGVAGKPASALLSEDSGVRDCSGRSQSNFVPGYLGGGGGLGGSVVSRDGVRQAGPGGQEQSEARAMPAEE